MTRSLDLFFVLARTAQSSPLSPGALGVSRWLAHRRTGYGVGAGRSVRGLPLMWESPAADELRGRKWLKSAEEVRAEAAPQKLSLSLSPFPPLPPSLPWVPFLSSLIGKNRPTPFLLFTFLLSYFLLPGCLSSLLL